MPYEALFDQLRDHLHAWLRRHRLHTLLIWTPRAVLAALLLAAIVAAVGRFRPLLTNAELALLTLALVVAALLLSLAAVLLRRLSLPAQARLADRRFDLQERVTTAVEIHAHTIATTPALARLQLEDTLAAADRVDLDEALPLAFNPQTVLVIFLATAMLLTAFFVNNPQTGILQGQRATAASIADQAAQLEALAEEIRQNPDLTAEQRDALLEPIEEALQQLEERAQTPEEAVEALSQAEAELRALENETGAAELQEALQSAGPALAMQSDSQALGQSMQTADVERTGTELSQLASRLPDLSEAAQNQLADNLAQAADALHGSEPQLAEALQQAADALAEGDTEGAQEGLEQAASMMTERAGETAVAQQAQSAGAQLRQGRQAIAQAAGGSEAGQQAATNEAAAGSESAQDRPNSQAQGSGQGQGQPSSSGEQGASGDSTSAGGPSQGGGHTENVFVPAPIDLSEVDGVEVELPAECRANPADCGGILSETPREFGEGGSVVPYAQVFGDYRSAANEALSADYIPLGLKGFVRDYFTSLEPGE